MCSPTHLPTTGVEPDKQAASDALRELAETLPGNFPEARATSLVGDALFWLLSRYKLISPTFEYAWDSARLAAVGPQDFKPDGTSYFGEWLGSAKREDILKALHTGAEYALTNPPPPRKPGSRMSYPDERP